jgi:UDP-2,3-diacylglucosamine pyrophosphatase LpxH
MKSKKIKALFISDIHLGSQGSHAEMVLDVLKQYEPECLFLVGDIIDGWLLKKRFFWPQSHTNVLRKILSHSKDGARIIYIPGNHDDFMRQYLGVEFGNIEVRDEYEYEGIYITHGDLYDGVVKLKWLGVLGSYGYDLAISIDRYLKRLGYKKSLSKWLKNQVKEAVKFVTDFENQIVWQADKRQCHTAICGHIHKAEDKMVNGIRYLNTGDWVESFTYVTMDTDGKLKLRHRDIY